MPTPDQAVTATVAALATENARLATQPLAQSAALTPTVSLGKLAYVQGGDIRVKALPDAEAQPLTADGRNSEPRWSPSGEWLAFRKGGDQVWVMQADGGVACPLSGGTAVGTFTWAPRADRLAYITGPGALVAVNADGSNWQELVIQGSGEPYTGVVRMAWSPDGEWLAYERVDVLQKERPAERYAGLWRIRADGGGATEVLNAGTPATYEPLLAGWSPDGLRLLFWKDPQFSGSLLADGVPLLALPADGGSPIQLAEAVLSYRDFVVPAPSGTDRLAVIVGGSRGAWTNKVVHVLSASTGEDMALTWPKLAASSPAWSPDGLHLAYVAMPDEGDPGGGEEARLGMMQRRIWVVNADGSNAQQLIIDPAYRDEYPLWSAKGSHILFGRFDAEDRASLWLISTAGGEPQQVVDKLTPLPGPASSWFGYYGHVEWDTLFDWWRGLGAQPVQPETPTLLLPPTRLPVAPPAECPHIPLGGFYDVWRNEQVWPRLGCAVEAAIPINGTEAHLCCNLHSIWIQEKHLFVTLDRSNSRWAFVADGSGLPADVVYVTPTWQPPTATPGPPPPTPAPTPTQVPPPTPPTATQAPSPSPQPSVTSLADASTPLPTLVLMTRLSWSLSEPCFQASGRHGWLANLSPWAERCQGLSAANETIFNGAMEQFKGGWLLWNGNVCFVLFADGTWTIF